MTKAMARKAADITGRSHAVSSVTVT